MCVCEPYNAITTSEPLLLRMRGSFTYQEMGNQRRRKRKFGKSIKLTLFVAFGFSDTRSIYFFTFAFSLVVGLLGFRE